MVFQIVISVLGKVERIKYLMKTLFKFTLVKSNLDVILSSHRSVLNKEGIGYTRQINQLKHRNFLSMRKPSSITCFYYFEIGHASNSCYFKIYDVPKGKYKWVPRGTSQAINIKGPKFN